MTRNQIMFILIEYQLWCKRTKDLEYEISWAKDDLVEEMLKENIAGFYVPKINSVVFNPNRVYMSVVFHEVGHAYDFVILGQKEDNERLTKETNAFYYGYCLAREFVRDYPQYDHFRTEMLYEMISHYIGGPSLVHGWAAQTAIRRLIRDNIISNREVNEVRRMVMSDYAEAAIADYNERVGNK
jgi:hypothetical protein